MVLSGDHFIWNIYFIILVSENVLIGIQKVDVFKSFPVDGHLGAIHSTIIANTVFISVARAPGSICGPAYILKCSLEMHCGIHQTIRTNSPTMEFFSYETFHALFVAHWKAGMGIVRYPWSALREPCFHSRPFVRQS